MGDTMGKWNFGNVYTNLEETDFDDFEALDKVLLAMVDMALEYAKVQTVITSDYREGDPGAHGRGLALDLSCEDSHSRMRLLHGVLGAGFKRVGIYPTHIHVDVDSSRPQDVIWHWCPEQEGKE